MSSCLQNSFSDFCNKNKHRYTKPRKNVLRVIANSEKPLKAYEVLKKLANGSLLFL